MREDWQETGAICVNVSRTDLDALKSGMVDLDKRILDLKARQVELPEEISGLIAQVEKLASLFESVLGERTRFILSGVGFSASQEEKAMAALHSDQITLAMDTPTREQLLSIMDIIRKVSLENDGVAPKEEVLARAGEIKIPGRMLEEILSRLRRADALEMEGDNLRLL